MQLCFSRHPNKVLRRLGGIDKEFIEFSTIIAATAASRLARPVACERFGLDVAADVGSQDVDEEGLVYRYLLWIVGQA